MSEKININKNEQSHEGGKLSKDDIQNLINKYGTVSFKKEHGIFLEEDPTHGEYFKIGNRRIQKLKTIGRVGMVDGSGGKPKPVEQRIKEILGLEEEKW